MDRFQIKLSLWVAIALIQVHGYKACLEKERMALLDIKSLFLSISDKDLAEKILSSWVDDPLSDCCAWQRIKCNATTDRVMELSLNATRQFKIPIFPDGFAILNLSLFLPFQELQSLDLSENFFQGWDDNKGSFGSLKQLKILNLGTNYFNSSLLEYLTTLTSLTTLIFTSNLIQGFDFKSKQGLTSLKNLEFLDLSSNGIYDSLPRLGLANLQNLEVLDISYTQMNGSLESQGICELRNLVELNLRGNLIDGQVPQCFSNLTNLKVLDLSFNQLSGNLPSNIANLTWSLEYLSLSGNNFEGVFSFSLLANHSKLEVFQLSPNNNMLRVENENWLPTYQLKVLYLSNLDLSVMPSFFLHQYSLQSIYLSHNKLVGKFPTWLLINNSNLKALYLKNNSFSGTLQLPETKHDLLHLDISKNHFSGQLPMDIGMILPKLQFMDMSGNSFQGNIPSSMGEMGGLKLLDFSSNNFSGELPKHFVSRSFSLRFLNLSENNFHGQIFPDYTNLTSLWWLYLANNHFSGNMGDGLFKSTSLEVLDISNNMVSGRIPGWIGNFSDLKFLIMSKNKLQGNVPVQLSNLRNLLILNLSENRLVGSLSSSLNFSSLVHLSMQRNSLGGSIPNSLFNSSKLRTMDLRENEFSGSISELFSERSDLSVLLLGANHLEGNIPDQLCRLKNLRILDLSLNRFNGSIPSCFSNMLFWVVGDVVKHSMVYRYPMSWAGIVSSDTYYNSTLTLRQSEDSYSVSDQRVEVEFTTKNRHETYVGTIVNYISGLDLSSNELTGEIPSKIGQLKEIRALNLSHNFLSGSIPESFSNLKMTESLDLSHNNLSGLIPPQLTGLNYLAIFNVSYNNLYGPTPNAGQFANFDESNYGGNPHLCGSTIKNSCTSVLAAPAMPSAEAEEDESAIDMVAFYWSFAASFVTIILVMFAILLLDSHLRRVWFYYVNVCIESCFNYVY